MIKHFFISGLFRSGTTFLARALNTHPDLKVLSDPHRAFFKFVRNKFFLSKQEGFDEGKPLSDYFLEEPSLRREFLSDFFQIKLTKTDIETLKKDLEKGAELFSPFIKNNIDLLKEGSVSDVYEQLIDLGGKAYSIQNEGLIGTKEVWTDEFISKFLETGKKCIHIIRDPRALISSNRVSEYGAYPLLFLIRQWRKSVAYYCLNKGNDNYLMIRYEDIVADKEASFRTISNFLNIPFNAVTIDDSKYVDGSNNPWKKNTSYSTSAINNVAGPRWKQVLNKSEVSIVEHLCLLEMKLLEYEFTSDLDNGVFLNKEFIKYESKENRAEWIKKYDFEFTETQYLQEEKRMKMINEERNSDDSAIENYFITKQAYNTYKHVAKL
jgi:hypothetical protein